MTQERKEILKKQITELVQNEEIFAILLACENVEQVGEVLKKQNIDVTVEEISEMRAEGELAIKNAQEASGDELDLENLENVTGGGSFWRGLAAATGAAVLGFTLGVVAAPAAGTIGLGYAAVSAVWVATGK